MKVIAIFGTRPEGIKMIPVVKELKSRSEFNCLFLNTAQHREMLDQVLDLFHLKSDFDLNMMSEKLPMPEMFAEMVKRISRILAEESPDIVLVHGDTLTTSAGALAAFYTGVPVGHVEAGLRTYDLTSPYPEEANRQITGVVSDIHFASTETNKKALLNEGKKPETIHVVGNSVIDSLLDITNRDITVDECIQAFAENGLKTILMTTHRRENLHNLKNVYYAVNRILKEHDDVQIIFPVHKNPIVREEILKYLNKNDRVHLIEPQDYATFAYLMKSSHFILTDSGGIQEEAPSLGKPVLVARNNTERPEGVEAGTLKLCGVEEENIYISMKKLLTDKELYRSMSVAENPYGDGHTSKLIADILLDFYKK